MDDRAWEEIWRKVDAVFGWLSKDEAKKLFDMAKAAPPGSYSIELGAFMGRSTVALASGVAEASALASHMGKKATAPFSVSIDIWIGTQNSSDSGIHESMMKERGVTDMFELHRKNMDTAGVSRWVRRIRGRSTVEAIEWAREWQISVGALFIDACHDYEAVRADFDTWAPLIVKGGTLAFHDSFAPGPKQTISEVGAPFKRMPDVGSMAIFLKE